jgi:cytochrome c-type protein NapB
MRSRRPPPGVPGFSRLDIVRAVVLMTLLVLVLGAGLERDREELVYPEPTVEAGGEAPIASEARVFLTREDELGVAPDFDDDRPAHVRSIDMYRRLRAFPGAPPRIPHGLTTEEFQTQSCNVCHQRGGWVARFATYAPVSPHSDYVACLQCHAPRDELVGRPLRDADTGEVCTQCHVNPDAASPSFVALDWQAPVWPATDVQALEGSPHVIPHTVESRGNCLSCHSGPGAVVELRTDHPERVNCRQCHVPAPGAPIPWPPTSDSGRGDGGGS